MPDVNDQLAVVTLNGGTVRFSSAVLVYALRDWHVVLYAVPPDSCPPQQASCDLTLTTTDGRRLRGTAVAELAADNGAYVLLTGVDRLSRSMPADVA